MNNEEYEENIENYKTKMYEKMERFKMNTEEYQTFLLQGIKKELIAIRRQLTEKQQTQ